MIADRNGEMPETIRNAADQHFLQDSLDHAAAVVHGRRSHEGGPRAGRRRRIIVTRQIAALAPDPSHPNALLWNPAGASFERALAEIGAINGTVAIIGGTEVFSMFLPFYDSFHLSRAAHARIPAACRSSPKSGQTRRRKTYCCATGSSPARRAISMPPPGLRL